MMGFSSEYGSLILPEKTTAASKKLQTRSRTDRNAENCYLFFLTGSFFFPGFLPFFVSL